MHAQILHWRLFAAKSRVWDIEMTGTKEDLVFVIFGKFFGLQLKYLTASIFILFFVLDDQSSFQELLKMFPTLDTLFCEMRSSTSHVSESRQNASGHYPRQKQSVGISLSHSQLLCT